MCGSETTRPERSTDRATDNPPALLRSTAPLFRRVTGLLPILLALGGTLATPARAQPELAIAKAGHDVYRVEVRPGDRSGSGRIRNRTTSLSWTNNEIELTRKGAAIWRGRIVRLDTYGRLNGPGLRVEWDAVPGEVLYGLGERFNGLNQAGKWVEMWLREEPGQGKTGSPSYFCTPVLYSSRGYALFAADNPEGEFDLNSRGDGLNRYARVGSSLTLYVAAAPTLKELVLKRARLQGPFRGVPDWVWGPWISRNSFENQDEAEAVVKEMIRRELPVSAIVQEAWKGPSETNDWNNFSRERWPDPDAFIALCAQHGIRNVLWQVPVIHPLSPSFADASNRHYFVRRPDGSVSFREAWLKDFANVDFTRPEAARWWQDQMRDEVRRGVWGFKADDGEDIKADDVFADGRRGEMLHNEYTVLYAQALTDLFDEEGVKGVLWCRSASLGSERTPALWAGDQFATWPQYRSLIAAGLSAGLSGAPFWGHDIGGYLGDPTPELYIRWLQFGAFSPLMQYHGQKPREPWLFGPEAEDAYRLLTHIRSQLRPALIRLGREAARTGLPLMRPMILEFPEDARFIDEETQYMLGPDMLVTPVLEEGAVQRRVKFPTGTWRHPLRDEIHRGPSEEEVQIGLVDAPIFLRVGSGLNLTPTP